MTPWRHIHYLIKHYAMKMYWGNGGTAPCILNLDTRSGWIHALATLPWRKNPQYPLDRRLGGIWSWSGCGGEKKFQPLLRIPGWPARSLVTIVTELPRLFTNKICSLIDDTFYINIAANCSW
jgi:hypothetical protein